MDPATEPADAWWRPRANDAGVNASALQDASLLRAAAPALELVVAYLASNASALLDDALERLPAVAQKVSETIQIHSRKCHSHQTRLVSSPRAVAAAQSRTLAACARNAACAREAHLTPSPSQVAAPVIRSLRENARGLVSDVLRDVMWPVLAVLVLSHLISVCVMLCLLRCGGAALRVASAALFERIRPRSGTLLPQSRTAHAV